MDKNAYTAWLLDFYGAMLTERQRHMLSQHLDEDFSITEIARLENVSRQGVHDTVKRAEAQLYQLEEKLGLLRRYFALRDGAQRALEYLEAGKVVRAKSELKLAFEREEKEEKEEKEETGDGL
ncbi:MAG: YlxM family DNA-binding protein [Christensenellales bacterium]